MGKTYDHVADSSAEFIARQTLFFVASAPLSASGHVNLSPKGLDSFRVLDPQHVAYLDLTGSGAETIAHLRENGRITLLFCALSGPPLILRIYGRGLVVEPEQHAFAALRARFGAMDGVRAIIHVQVERVAESCGFGVPLYEFVAQRDQIPKWSLKKGAAGLRRFRSERNRCSLDGLPALDTDLEESGD
jgi:hypothetical protein